MNGNHLTPSTHGDGGADSLRTTPLIHCFWNLISPAALDQANVDGPGFLAFYERQSLNGTHWQAKPTIVRMLFSPCGSSPRGLLAVSLLPPPITHIV